MAADVLAKLSVQIDAQTAQFASALKLLEAQTNKFGQAVNNQTTALSRFEKGVAGIQRSLGSLGLAFGAFQAANILRSAISSIIDFERQMSIVSAISGATGKSLQELKDDALRLGASTRFTAQQIAELQTELGRLGFTTSEILNTTESVARLSVATGEDLAKSAAVVGNVVRAFNLNASESTRVVDVMASSFNKSALALDNFQDSMKYVAPISASANVSLEETTALLGILADAGIQGSQAGTSLRRIITDLAKDGRPLAERLQELSDRGLTFGGAMDEVGRFAQAALLVLSKNTDRIDTFTQELSNAAGTADEMASIMEDNLSGAIVRLTSAYDGFVQSLSDGTGPLRTFVEDLTTVVNIITDISNFVRGEGGTLSKILKFLWDVGPIGATNKLLHETLQLYRDYKGEVDAASEAQKKLRDEQKQSAIESTVNAALASGNVEAYIKALDQNIYKEEIIAEIRKRQNEELRKQAEAITNQVGIVEALKKKIEELGKAIDKATSVSQIRQLQHELEGVQIQLNKILKGVTEPPEPVVIPITFDVPDLDVRGDVGSGLLDAINNIVPGGFVIPVEIDIPEDEIHEAADKSARAGVAAVTAFTDSFNAILQDFIANSLVAFGEAIGNALSGGGISSFGEDILKAVAGFLGQFGKMLIAAGVAAIALKKLIVNPLTAIAAGVALVALSKAVSNSVSNAAQSVSTGVAGGGSERQTPERLAESARSIRVEFGVTEFRIRGRDLAATLNNQQDFNSGLAGG